MKKAKRIIVCTVVVIITIFFCGCDLLEEEDNTLEDFFSLNPDKYEELENTIESMSTDWLSYSLKINENQMVITATYDESMDENRRKEIAQNCEDEQEITDAMFGYMPETISETLGISTEVVYFIQDADENEIWSKTYSYEIE